MWMAAVYQPVYPCNDQIGGYCPNDTTPIVGEPFFSTAIALFFIL